MGFRDFIKSFLHGSDHPTGLAAAAVQPPQITSIPTDFRGILDLTIAQGSPELQRHAIALREKVDTSMYGQETLGGFMSSMISKSQSTMISTGGVVGVNDYGVKGRRQYAAERRRLLDLYVIVLNNADIRTATIHLRNEVFRRGITLVPAFDFRCPICGAEYSKTKAAQNGYKCTECGDPNARVLPPDPSQIRYFRKLAERCNYFGQSFEQLLRACEDDVNIVDDAFIYLRVEYAIDEATYQQAIQDPFNDDYGPEITVKQIFRLDPTLVEFDLDTRGIPGQAHHACPFHRDVLLDVPFDEGWDIEWQGKCEKCGLRTYPIYYKYSEQQAGSFGARRPEVLYLFDNEIIHYSKFSPCYDYQTEVLTRSAGWKRIADVDLDTDEVATRTPEGFLEWRVPRDKVILQYSGPMWRAKGQRVDMCMTPGHKLWARGVHATNPKFNAAPRTIELHEHDGYPRHDTAMKHVDLGEFKWGNEGPRERQLVDTYGLVEAHRVDPKERIYMTNTMTWAGEDTAEFELPGYEKKSKYDRYHPDGVPTRRFAMNDWLEFLGYYLAEGNSHDPIKYPHHPPVITQDPVKNPETLQRIKDCLDRLGLHWTSTANKVRIWDPAVREYVRQFGKSADKFVPNELKNLPPARLVHLFDALMAGDGRYGPDGNPHTYRSFSLRLLDDTAEIAMKLGYQIMYLQRKAGPPTGIRFGSHREAELCLNPGMYGMSDEKMHPAAIFGLEVPNHVMLTRRNGKIVWAGNTETYGFPPVLSFYEKALTLIGMDRYLYDYFYERRVPQGVVAAYTDDPEGLTRSKEEIEANMQRDPHYIPWIAVSAKTQQGKIEFVRFAYSLEELDYLPVRDEIRERIAAMYGVSQIWMNSAQNVGGLNEESQQIVVTSRATESAQQIYHEGAFPKIERALKITDWHIRLVNPEETAELTKAQVLQVKATHAQTMVGMGFGADYDSDAKEFSFHGSIPSQQDIEKQQQGVANQDPFAQPGQGQQQGQGQPPPENPPSGQGQAPSPEQQQAPAAEPGANGSQPGVMAAGR